MTPAPADRGRTVTVSAVRPVADRLVEVLLVAGDGTPLPRWTPGAHVDLVLPTGLTRPYSLAGDPGDGRSWRLLVARSADQDGAGAYVHDVLRPGHVLRVRGPRQLFAVGGAPRYLFASAGAGIAPLLPMARLVRSARVYPWSLVHVDRSGPGTPLGQEVADLGPAARTVADRASLLEVVAAAQPGTSVYACGSSRLVQAVAEAAAPGVQVHVQRFDAPTRTTGADRAYEVVLARRGERMQVAAGTNLLTTLHAAGAEVAVSCGVGICGACVVGIVEGAVEHRDSVLTGQERAAGRLIVTCVSTAAEARLVLDL
ncbi:oxidoreductase [Geodermatophilaceae bacterium NBWT11]|nr:oxidoreductase [Geodermatophilaceae bacterium NBWT11]